MKRLSIISLVLLIAGCPSGVGSPPPDEQPQDQAPEQPLPEEPQPEPEPPAPEPAPPTEPERPPDFDADGVLDEADNCFSKPNPDQTDADDDGVGDVCDVCPSDPEKVEPGICGCGQPDIVIDTDADGVPDCVDLCPLDPFKLAPGICGCGIDDLDLDRDGLPDLCMDNCPLTFNPDQLDSDFDGLGDACDSTPVGSGDVFSFLTPDETELFLLFVATLNADIDRLVDEELALVLMDLRNRGFGGSTMVCNAECDAEQSRVSLKRDGTALCAIDAAASSGINLILGLAEWNEIHAFNCENYPNRSLTCDLPGLPAVTCTIGGPPCD